MSRTFTLRFKDMTEAESAPLLNYLCDHAVRPEFTCRFAGSRGRWRSGTTARSTTRSTITTGGAG